MRKACIRDLSVHIVRRIEASRTPLVPRRPAVTVKVTTCQSWKEAPTSAYKKSRTLSSVPNYDDAACRLASATAREVQISPARSVALALDTTPLCDRIPHGGHH
ncbi:hypothetical protein PM082_011833 [Marasmius tenuissimus]|nr:hypothetical protein PM082_011833 [Marasmius tenuissimus]